MRKQLRQARINRGWTLEQAAESIDVHPNTLSLWERGDQAISDKFQNRLCKIYGITIEDLKDESEKQFLISSLFDMYVQSNLTMYLISLALAPYQSYKDLQKSISQALKEHVHTPATQREALRNLVLLALTSSNSRLSNDILLNVCAAGIIACGYVSNSEWDASWFYNDMSLVLAGVESYEAVLQPLIKQARYRRHATSLLSLGLQIKSRASSNLLGMKQAIVDSERAVEYARESRNRTMIVMAVRALTADLEDGITEQPGRREKALQLAEEALDLIEHGSGSPVPDFIVSWLFTGLAKYQALHNREQDMLTALSKADETFPISAMKATPGHISYSYAHLLRHRAITYAYFGKQDEAYKIFQNLIDDSFQSLVSMPTRMRIGTLSEYLFTTLYLPPHLKDKERSIALWKVAWQETSELRSESYFDEARLTYQIMRGIWSDDTDVLDLRDLLVNW